MKLQLKRSNVIASGAAKIPTAAQLEYGELAINYNQQDPAIFLKDSNNNVIRIGGIGNIADDGQVELPTTTNPPTSPTPLNGNLWYNSQDGRLYVYYVDANSAQWVDASPDNWQSTVIPDITDPAYQAGTLDDRYINISGDTLTGALLLDNAAAAATPDLAFDGDLNTGIYSPGADSLAIATAGTQRVVVDASGNLGVGTTSPSSLLNIETAVDTQLRIESTSGSSNNESAIQLIRGSNQSAIKNKFGGLEFYTGGLTTERIRITSAGNVGIGNAAPAQKLHVAGKIRYGANTTYYGEIEHDEGSTGANIYNSQDTGGHIFKNSGSEKLRIDNSGNVGIGNVAPAAKLHLEATSEQLRITHTSIVSYRHEAHSNGDYSINKDGTERMRITSGGLVGIGTSTPSHPLDVRGGNTQINFAATESGGGYLMSTNAGQWGISGGVRFNGAGWYARHTHSSLIRDDGDGAVRFFVNNGNTVNGYITPAERMRIDTVGLSVGKTAYASIGTDGHHINKAGWAHHCMTNDAPLYMNRNGTDGNIAALYKAGVYRGNIYVNGSVTTFNSVSDYRLKENIIDITDGITRIKQLSPRRFNFIENADLTVDGFIAHEAQVVVPEAVCGEKDGDEMQGIDQSKLVPLLTAALQEAIAKIETLEQRLSDAGIA